MDITPISRFENWRHVLYSLIHPVDEKPTRAQAAVVSNPYGSLQETRGTLQWWFYEDNVWVVINELGEIICTTSGHRPSESDICFGLRVLVVGEEQARKEFG